MSRFCHHLLQQHVLKRMLCAWKRIGLLARLEAGTAASLGQQPPHALSELERVIAILGDRRLRRQILQLSPLHGLGKETQESGGQTEAEVDPSTIESRRMTRIGGIVIGEPDRLDGHERHEGASLE